MISRTHTLSLAPAALAALLLACSSSGPPPVRTGTPAYYWQNAREAYDKGDYAKATDWLDKITAHSKSEFTDRGWAFRLLLAAGQIRAHRDLVENYDYGAKANKANPTPFIKKVTEYRSAAARASFQFGQLYEEYLKTQPGAEIPIDFPLPATGTVLKPPILNTIAQGQAPSDSDMASVFRAMIHRGMIQTICEIAGAKEDTAKTRAVLQTLPYKAPRAVFETIMATTLYEGAKLHGPRLDAKPAVREFLGKKALQAMESVTATDKETKELRAKIEKELKEAEKANKG